MTYIYIVLHLNTCAPVLKPKNMAAPFYNCQNCLKVAVSSIEIQLYFLMRKVHLSTVLGLVLLIIIFLCHKFPCKFMNAY